MQNLTRYRVIRAIGLAGLAALILATHAFVFVDRLRVTVIEAPTPASAGLLRVTTIGFPQANDLQPPFALIVRIDNQSGETGSFSITMDGAPICERSVGGGRSRRLDCAVTEEWNPTIDHVVAIQGPPGAWELERLELATHHGNTDGAHSLVILPASSDQYTRPALGWVVATWLIVTTILLLPAAPALPRWLQRTYLVVAGAIVLELGASLISEWISSYRIVLYAGTCTTWLTVLFAPRLWAACRWMVYTAATHVDLKPAAALALFVGVVTGWQLLHGHLIQDRTTSEQLATIVEVRQALRDKLRPVTLANCTLRRFGGLNDGGYLMCENLIKDPESAYSYGIAGEDNWGCDLSRKFRVPIHQYDCFDTSEPVCEGGRFIFHAECIANRTATIESRPFDTLANQIARNGDAGKRLIVKMDVEGAEWYSLLATPDSVLDRIEQLPMELHGTDDRRFVEVVRKLKRTFYLAHIHFNNMACGPGVEPFPAFAFQVLFVNKRIGLVDASAPPPLLPNPADAPDNPDIPDCQPGI